MAVTVTMPQLGETVTEGTILRWAKQPGDRIEEDEILLEISTDKVDTEVPSPAAGILQEILVPEGETVGVGTALAVIAAPGEDSAEASIDEPAVVDPVPAVAEPAAEQPAAGVFEGPRRDVLSPVVRKLAAEHGVDLSQVPGSGDGGRITRKDVVAFAAAAAAPIAEAAVPVVAEPEFVEPAAAEAAAEPAVAEVAAEPEFAEPAAAEVAAEPEFAEPAAGAVAVAGEAEIAAPVAATAAPEEPAAAMKVTFEPATTEPGPGGIPLGPGDQVVTLDRLRVRIAENMVRAKRSTAHVWTSVEVDYEPVAQLRLRHRAEFKAQEGFSLTYLPFLARATVDALAAFPVVNSSFFLEEKQRVLHGRIHLGIAVDVNQQGLVVVTIRDADGLRLRGIARRIRDLAITARAGELTPDDVGGSTFTLTNPGPFGSFMSAPVINVPNSGILSTDTVEKRPTVLTLPDGTDTLGIHHIGYLGLTWDHRSFDGSTAVLFLQRIKKNIETWDWERELS